MTYRITLIVEIEGADQGEAFAKLPALPKEAMFVWSSIQPGLAETAESCNNETPVSETETTGAAK